MNGMLQDKGFTLMEVMVALFVLSVGILGIISLQLFAQQNNYDAIQRTTAAVLASSIVERMRINRAGINGYPGVAEPVPDTDFPNTCSSPPGCTPAQLAAHDLQEWYSLISGATESSAADEFTGGLAAPSACIRRDPAGTGGTAGATEYRIAIAWRGRSAISDPTLDVCGTGAIPPLYGDDNEFRRIFVLDVKIE
jgi:type IV pilus assembly protein PilV